MKRSKTIILSATLVLGIGVLATLAVRGPRASATSRYETLPSRRGEIVAMVNATGAIAPRNRVVLSFPATGRIAEVHVAVGDQVEAGQVLAALDARDLQQAVAQAEAALAMSQARLDQARRGASEQDLAAARANVASAEENLARVKAGASESEIEIARLRWEQAKDQLWSAQCQRDATVGSSSAPGAAKDQSQAAVASAEMAAEIARLQYEQTKAGPNPNDVRAAEAQLAQAQAHLATLTAGTSTEEVRAAQAQVDQNIASLEQARLRAEGAVLRAPFAGTIAAVSARVGEVAGMNTPVITLVDLSALHIDVDIDEASIGQVQVGQQAEITLDAFPNQTLQGQVARIDPVGTLSQGVVNYAVTVQLDASELPIKADMTAAVDIVTDRRTDVVLVPTRAVRRDRQGLYVEVLVNGRPQRVTIETGLTNDQDTEVTKGLKEGAQVIVTAPRRSPFSPSALGM
ncbi:MAG: efflux RND transporter periplasmic adaptor subunit [Anaerolineae bacterium]